MFFSGAARVGFVPHFSCLYLLAAHVGTVVAARVGTEGLKIILSVNLPIAEYQGKGGPDPIYSSVIGQFIFFRAQCPLKGNWSLSLLLLLITRLPHISGTRTIKRVCAKLQKNKKKPQKRLQKGSSSESLKSKKTTTCGKAC